MLVCCMFLDEHVNHEPQAILYFQDKFALQNGEYHVFFKPVDLSLASVGFTLVSFTFLQP